jgi:pimeloyl-ACP methyl ester carboxylesterase
VSTRLPLGSGFQYDCGPEDVPTVPETRYAKSSKVHIAYQMVGDGPFDLVFVPGFVSHVEAAWESPGAVHFFERLARFCRLIMFDKRGTGLSDPAAGAQTLEERMDDVRAVMDAAGCERAALLGVSEGGPMSVLFAATYPQRVRALVLYGTTARFVKDEGYACGLAPEQLQAFTTAAEEGWGRGTLLETFAPSMANDAQFVAFWSRFQRQAASPGMVRALLELIAEIDVRPVLPTIAVPTLVLHRTDEVTVNVEAARYLAERIPGARMIEQPGMDHVPWVGDADGLLDEIEEFLTGTREAREPDRVLATVLFTDIVGSTERAAELGDRRWRDLLDAHHTIVRRELGRSGGREVDTAGDGFFATFDGPARAVRSACAIQEAVGTSLGVPLRAGLHTGECEIMHDRVGGIAVHIGARVAAKAGAGEVLVSSTVKDLVAGSGLRFADRGMHVLKGVPDKWRLFAVAR